MDPLTAANTFATVIQLVGMFKLEHKEAQNVDDKKFIEWLAYHRHDDVKNLICNTAALQTEVINLLRKDNAAILSKLDSINTTLAKLLSNVDGFEGLSKILLPSAELSEQAVFVLRQLVESKQKNLVYGELPGGAILHPEAGEPFQYYDSLFLSDDIDSLEECGLLRRRDGGGDLTKIYGITRAGADYIKTLDQAGASEMA